jgi:hypothetical protein
MTASVSTLLKTTDGLVAELKNVSALLVGQSENLTLVYYCYMFFFV